MSNLSRQALMSKAKQRLKELTKEYKAVTRKVLKEDGTFEMVTTPPKWELYGGVINIHEYSDRIILRWKVLEGYEELKGGVQDKDKVIAKNPIVKEKSEVIK